MGDGLQLLPIAKGLKQAFPYATITLLTSTGEAPVFDRQEDISQIYILNKEEIIGRLNAGSKADIIAALQILASDLETVGATQWDWIINFSHTYSSAILSFILNGKYRSGFQLNQDRQYLAKEKWFSYSLASFSKRRYSNFNWVDINKNIAGIASVPPPPYLKPTDTALQEASRFITAIGRNRGVIGMHPGASGTHKRWPKEKFAKLGKRLA